MPPDTNEPGFRSVNAVTPDTISTQPIPTQRNRSLPWAIGLLIAAAIATFFMAGIGGDGGPRVDPAAGPTPAGATAPPGPSAAPTGIPQQQGALSNARPQPGPGNPAPAAGGAAPPGPSSTPTAIPQQRSGPVGPSPVE